MGQATEEHIGYQPKVGGLVIMMFFFLTVIHSRVTKFKINWDNTAENAENVPPKVDPNQMSSENSQSMDGPLKSGNGLPGPSVGMETD